MLSGLAADQLCRNGERHPLPPFPRLDVTFDYFDEVWAISEGRTSCVALRLTHGGAGQHHTGSPPRFRPDAAPAVLLQLMSAGISLLIYCHGSRELRSSWS